MIEGLEGRLNWFADNLALLLEDVALEAESYAVDLYFDTVDVSYALVGIDSFKLDRDGSYSVFPRFRSSSTMVQVLAADGWLGQFGMLPPHEAEFLHGLNQDFGVERVALHAEGKVRAFLQSLSSDSSTAADPIYLSTLSASDLLTFVRKKAKEAADVFKVIQMIKLPWPGRLKQWRDRNLLQISGLSTNQFEYHAVVGTSVFQKALKALTSLRPTKGPANFSDACALGLLWRKVEEFKEGRSVRLPRFLASLAWERTIDEASLGDAFQYRTLDGRISSVTRTPEYFIFKALYQPAKMPGRSSRKFRPLFGTVTELRELEREVRSLLAGRKPVTKATIDKILVGDRTLIDVIDEIKCFSFFENVWLPTSWEAEAQRVLRLLSRGSRQLAHERFRKGVERAIEVTKQDLANSVASYEMLSEVWRRLRREARTFGTFMGEAVVDERFLRLDLGLLPFGFPEECERRTCELVEKVLAGGAGAEDALGWVLQVMAKEGPLAGEDSEVVIATGLLWILHLDRENLNLVDRAGGSKSSYLLSIEAAALLRLGGDIEPVHGIALKLSERFAGEDNPDRRGQLGIALGYIYYRLWLNEESGELRNEVDARVRDLRREGFKAEALKYSEISSTLPGLAIIRRVYALNQYLFYLVEMLEVGNSQRLEDVSNALLGYRERARNVWCFRYDDTLSRFYHSLATRMPASEAKANLIENAIRFAKRALQASHGNERVENYWARLSTEYASDISRVTGGE